MTNMSQLPPLLLLAAALLNCLLAAAQTAAARPRPEDLAAESTAVVVGKVVSKSRVVRKGKPDAAGGPMGQGDIAELPSPKEYQPGTVAFVRVGEVVKTDGRIKPGRIVSVFIPGWIHKEGDPVFSSGRSYLIFLCPAAANKALAGTVVEKFGSANSARRPFKVESSYNVTWGESGLLPITRGNRRLVARTKAVVRAAPGKRRRLGLSSGPCHRQSHESRQRPKQLHDPMALIPGNGSHRIWRSPQEET
jgi:hypothetical protein